MIKDIKLKSQEILKGKWSDSFSFAFAFFLFTVILSIIFTEPSKFPYIGFIFPLFSFIFAFSAFVGLIGVIKKFDENKEVKMLDFLYLAFHHFLSIWKILWNIILKNIVLILFCIIFYVVAITSTSHLPFFLSFLANNFGRVAGIIASIGYLICIFMLIPKLLYYTLSYFVFFDFPNLSEKECVEKSAILMSNNRWNLCKLFLSFLGWFLLLGIIFVIITILHIDSFYLLTVLAYIGISFLTVYIITCFLQFYETLKKQADKNN